LENGALEVTSFVHRVESCICSREHTATLVTFKALRTIWKVTQGRNMPLFEREVTRGFVWIESTHIALLCLQVVVHERSWAVLVFSQGRQRG